MGTATKRGWGGAADESSLPEWISDDSRSPIGDLGALVQYDIQVTGDLTGIFRAKIKVQTTTKYFYVRERAIQSIYHRDHLGGSDYH